MIEARLVQRRQDVSASAVFKGDGTRAIKAGFERGRGVGGVLIPRDFVDERLMRAYLQHEFNSWRDEGSKMSVELIGSPVGGWWEFAVGPADPAQRRSDGRRSVRGRCCLAGERNGGFQALYELLPQPGVRGVEFHRISRSPTIEWSKLTRGGATRTPRLVLTPRSSKVVSSYLRTSG